MTVLVTGATGKTGRLVAESLVNRGVGVRAMVRDIERGKMATLGMAVELVLGDFNSAETIAAAVEGCESMYLVASDSTDQVRQEVDAARIAVEAGVGHIVKLSSSDAGQRHYAWSVAHAEIESSIANMGVQYSVLRPHYFMQNYLSLLKVDADGAVTLEAPANDGGIGAIDAYDIGESAASLLASGNALNDHALLTGPENISMSRVAEVFSGVVGRKITYVNLDPEQYRSELDSDSPGSAGDIEDVYEEVRVGTMAVHSDNVEKISGEPPRSIEQFAAENADSIHAAIEAAAKDRK